jgi:hypothetical protein
MTEFAGMRGTDSFGTDERPKNFREMILWMAPNGRAPLFALSARMKKEATDDPEFAWWEEVKDIGRVTLNEAGVVDETETTLTVAAFNGRGAFQFQPGDVLQVEVDDAGYTAELLKINSVTDATTIVVTREYAGTDGTSGITNGAGLTRIGSAYEEGSGAPTVVSQNPTKFLNKTQIFKTPYELTETAKETRFRTGDPLKNDQIRKSFTHSEKLEQAFFWGKVSEVTGSGGQPERTMAGLRELLTSNVTIFAADPTIDTFIEAISPVFDYEAGGAGDERIVYCGNGALNYLNKLVASDSSTRINYNGVIDIYGQRMFTFRIPQGTIAIKSHPLFNVHPLYTYSMFVVNPSGLVYRPLRNRDTKIQKNIQDNDADKQKDQWLTECSLEVHYERTFAYIGGVKDWP